MNNETDVIRVVGAFNDALNARDLAAMMGFLTPDSVFENTHPGPDGTRYEGREAVRGFWELFFRGAPETHFDVEEMFANADRCVTRWVYTWEDHKGKRGRVRGADIFKLRDGLIAEKLAYVKG